MESNDGPEILDREEETGILAGLPSACWDRQMEEVHSLDRK